MGRRRWLAALKSSFKLLEHIYPCPRKQTLSSSFANRSPRGSQRQGLSPASADRVGADPFFHPKRVDLDIYGYLPWWIFGGAGVPGWKKFGLDDDTGIQRRRSAAVSLDIANQESFIPNRVSSQGVIQIELCVLRGPLSSQKIPSKNYLNEKNSNRCQQPFWVAREQVAYKPFHLNVAFPLITSCSLFLITNGVQLPLGFWTSRSPDLRIRSLPGQRRSSFCPRIGDWTSAFLQQH